MTDHAELHVVLGTGPLGLAVAASLRKRNHRVRLVNRSGRADGLPAGFEIVAADASDANNVSQVTSGASVVYQCAQPPYTRWPAEFPPLQEAILEGVAATGARLVLAENLYLYGDTNGRALHETTAHAARGPKGRTRALMSERALAAHESGKVRVAIGRASDFFGPYVSASAVGAGVFRRILEGKPARVMGNPEMSHSYTFIQDFGEALAVLGEHEEAFGRAWHIPNAPAIPTRRFVEMVAEEAGRPARMQVAGAILLGLVGLVNREVRELGEVRYEFEKPFVVDSSRFETAFGMRATPLKEAIHRTVVWEVG